MDKTYEYYQHYTDASNIAYVKNVSAAHSWVHTGYGNNCPVFASPFINNCSFNAAVDMLQHIYGKLQPPVTAVTENVRPVFDLSFLI